MSLRELLDKRAGLVHEARGILEQAEQEDRSLNGDEEQRWNRLMEDATGLGERIQRQEQVLSVSGEESRERRMNPQGEDRGLLDGYEFRSRGMRGALENERGWAEEPGWQRLINLSGEERLQAWASWMRGLPVQAQEERALQVDKATQAGYLVTPMQFVDRLIQAMDNVVYMRQWGEVYSVPNADSLGAPSLDNDPADPTWTSELAIGSEDSAMSVGRRELKPHPLAKYIKISRTLLRKAPSSEDLVIRRLGYKFSVTAENSYLNGDGSGEPLGVFVASDAGISTSRDVSTGNTTTEMRFDGLIEAKYSLKMQYWPRSRWMFHRDGMKQIAKLKDGNGQYLWRESVRVGEPDRVLGIPAFMSEYAPSTFSTGEYVGILGDFSYYWIADALNMEMQRLIELYAATNQIALIGRMESDGMPVLEEAFVRVTLA